MARYGSKGFGDPLDVLAEEATEVIKEVLKARRFGLSGTPEWVAEGNPTPRDAIVQEIADFQVVLSMLVSRGFVTQAELDKARARKMGRLIDFYGTDAVRALLVPPDWHEPAPLVDAYGHTYPSPAPRRFWHEPTVDGPIDTDASHYVEQGVWQPDADPKGGRIQMWKHSIKGYVVYADHPESVKKGLPIAPWAHHDGFTTWPGTEPGRAKMPR